MFMGNEMCVYGEKLVKMCVYGEMFGIRLSRLLPMRKLRGSVFKMCVYGEKQIKMCVYGEGFGIRLSDSCFRCGN